MGITDTAMLRPQVFAFCDGEVQVGLICSEKQAIDATLHSLSEEDKRICPVADRYWNARGGSHTDGGTFIFNLGKNAEGKMRIRCEDKFGKPVPMPEASEACDFTKANEDRCRCRAANRRPECLKAGKAFELFEYFRDNIKKWSFDQIRAHCRSASRSKAAMPHLPQLLSRR